MIKVWNFFSVYVCLMFCSVITLTANTAEISDSIQASSIAKAADSLDIIQQRLNGHWRLLRVRTDKPNQTYSTWPEDSAVIFKTYMQGRFFYYHYGEQGELYESYGGHYRFVDATHLEEVIDYYAPYHHQAMYYGRDGQMTLSNGASMVGARVEITIHFDEEGHMYQTGYMHPNKLHLSKPESYGDRAIDEIYRQETPQVTDY